jgi:diguanylate cyclase (GGDEF)-like protein
MKLPISISLIVLFMGLFNSIAHGYQSFQVLVVHAYSQEYPWTASQHRGFVKELTEKSLIPINISIEYLDTKRRAYSPIYAMQFARYIREKYRAYTPNIIYVTDDNGYRFARDHLRKLYPKSPVIFSGVNDYKIIDGIKSLPMRGVFEKKDISKNIDLILDLDKKDTEIIILSDGSNPNSVIESEIKSQLAQYPKINVISLVHNNIEQLVEDLRKHNQKYLFLNTIGGIKSDAGALVSPEVVVSEITNAGNYTIIALEDSYFSDGVLGGYVTSGRLQGEHAARLALDLQKGISIEQIENIVDSPNTYIFDQSELDQLKISLPIAVREQTEFHNIPPSFYEKNRTFILTILTLMSLIIIALVISIFISRIKKNEKARKREKKRNAQIERYQNAMIAWSRVSHENIGDAFIKAAEISSATLDIKRVSIWLYNDSRTGIECRAMYVSGEGHSSGDVLLKADYPSYFAAIDSGRRLVINNVRTDPITRELVDPYLIQNDIYSMLDVPIFYDGNIIGVVCHEHIEGFRTWTTNEQDFSSLIASDISLSLEIDKRKVIEENLEYQAYHDSLTGLPNRPLFLDRIEQEIRHASRDNSSLAVLFLDLDNFKQINDSLGHSAGDTVLILISERLIEALRETDTVARFGGDEFTILLSEFSTVEDINDIVLKLFDTIHRPVVIDFNELFVTTSIGISVFPNDGASAEILLRNADAAMYRAKERGRNAFEFYTTDMTERALEKVHMIANLNRALEQDELEVFYQPQYDIHKKQLIGLEALVRWHHPDLGFLTPEKFLPTAEESGLIVALDRWVMRKSLQQMKAWKDEGLALGRLSLNLPMLQIDQPDFLETLIKLLKDTDCNGKSITFEITEGQLMKNPERTIKLLNHMSTLGIRVSVDDFGTGYSSLAYLKKLPVDTIKIDKTFIQGLPIDGDDSSIVKSMIALANSMRIDVIAEGVETSEQLDFLKKEGCRLIQGDYLSAPMRASDIAKLAPYPLEAGKKIKRSASVTNIR